MARKNKRKKRDQKSTPKTPEFKSGLFAGLKEVELEPQENMNDLSTNKSSVPVEEEKEDENIDDAELFLRAVSGAQKIESPAPPKRKPFTELIKVDEEVEAQAELVALVEGRLPFDISFTDEYVEGRAPGVPGKVLKKLKKGDYSIQAVLDLHGKTKLEAREKVQKFIEKCRVNGKRSVLIVHGRGIHSKDQIPVLKESLKAWFLRGRGAIGGGVLAFSTARPADGGLGAMYVLLRRYVRRT